jgi:predicted secreted protein
MENEGTSCPVNDKQVNEIAIRLVAMQVIFITATALYFQTPYIAVLLVLDFGFRAFGFSHLSPLKFIAQKTVSHFQLGYKATNEAPKRFAAKVGLFVVTLFSVSIFLQIHWLSLLLGTGLLLFAVLESGFGICVGCIIYQQLTCYKVG